REEAATMLVRVHRRLVGKTDWFHGFYAISSYAQRAVTQEMDAVSAGWSRLTWSAAAGVVLNTSSSGGNEFSIPTSYESITSYLEAGGAPLSLDVYASDSTVLTAVLTDEANRAAAVDAIMAEATRTYDAIGKSPYAGVTIDFEGLRGETMKAGFTAFLTALSARLAPLGMTLYVTVQPATADGTYYDGFDYRAIGEVADRVILMAHDYNATSLSGFEGSSYYKTTALTPLSSVYYSLRAVCDAETGVLDRSKIALAVSFSSLAWKTEDGLLVSGTPLRPSTSTIYARLKQEGTVLGWSDTYRNPYAVYDADGQEIFLWYEDARSVAEKVKLARLFGITGVSVWRIGLIPDYDDAGLYYNALPALTD
ncbi:MAG TPA: glycosyl hydrolase family 18 protein, partial [Oscillospiraceae bacterium]|nr:glycosyl hydrolase family 18 protein [Oscillospiraceae bacterium]